MSHTRIITIIRNWIRRKASQIKAAHQAGRAAQADFDQAMADGEKVRDFLRRGRGKDA